MDVVQVQLVYSFILLFVCDMHAYVLYKHTHAPMHTHTRRCVSDDRVLHLGTREVAKQIPMEHFCTARSPCAE